MTKRHTGFDLPEEFFQKVRDKVNVRKYNLTRLYHALLELWLSGEIEELVVKKLGK